LWKQNNVLAGDDGDDDAVTEVTMCGKALLPEQTGRMTMVVPAVTMGRRSMPS
jgi:hypothetical protein